MAPTSVNAVRDLLLILMTSRALVRYLNTLSPSAVEAAGHGALLLSLVTFCSFCSTTKAPSFQN